MRRIIVLIIFASILTFQYTAVSAISVLTSNSELLTFKQLQELFKSQNVIDQEIDLRNNINKKMYTDILDEYAELEDAIQHMNDQIEVLQIQVDQTINEATDAGKHDTVTVNIPPGSGAPPQEQQVNAKDYYLNIQLPGLMNAKSSLESMYEDMVKMQLTTYTQMEHLKLQLEFADKDKEQKFISSYNDFEELCYSYYLVSLEEKLITLEQELLEEDINNLSKQQALGLTTSTEVYLKENQLLNLKQKETVLNNKLDEYYFRIIKTLSIDTYNDPGFSIDITIPEVKEVMDYNTFESVVRSQSFTIRMLDEQENIYNHQRELAILAYDEGDKEFQKTILDIEKNEIKNYQSQQQMDILISQIYNSFLVAKKQLEVSKVAYEIATNEFEFSIRKQNLGQLSDYEFQDATYKFQKAHFDYEKSKVDFIHAYHTFEEALAGIL